MINEGLWAAASSSTNRPTVVLNYGLGVDSTAILLRWITDPSSRVFADGRRFELNDLVVITAMTGDEWESSGALVDDHILPLLRKHRIRYVQVARSGYSAHAGVTVLDDSRRPTRLHLAGDYPLSSELFTNAIVPQSGEGLRHCSEKQKGAIIGKTLDDLLPPGPYINVIGFDAEEQTRAGRGSKFDKPGRRDSKYPLIEWGWNRQQSLDFIHSVVGVWWLKSACVYCPFAWHSAGGRFTDPDRKRNALIEANNELFDRYLASPRAVVLTLAIEYGSRCVNPSLTLRVSGAVYDMFVTHGGFDDALHEFHSLINDTQHRIMDIRRVKRSPRRGDVYRSIGTTDVGDRESMRLTLESQHPGAVEFDHVTHRAWHRRVADRKAPSWAEFASVLVPRWVEDKHNAAFPARWKEITGETLVLPSIDGNQQPSAPALFAF